MRALLAALALLATAACAPTIQRAGVPEPAFTGPRIEADALVSHDGARLATVPITDAGSEPIILARVEKNALSPPAQHLATLIPDLIGAAQALDSQDTTES